MPISTIGSAGLTSPLTGMTISSPTLTTPNIDSAQIATVSGTAPLYMCRAWVNFSGVTSISIKGSGNVTSVTRSSTGVYAISFTNALVDANYSVIGVSQGYTPAGAATFMSINASSGTVSVSPTTSSFTVAIMSYNTSMYDSAYVNLAVFR